MELEGVRVAILVEQQYEDLELWYPYLRFQEAGAEVFLVGSGSAERYASKHGYPAEVDADADTVDAQQFDVVVIPGGWAPDHLRRHENVLNFVRDAADAGKIIAAICHAGSVLVSARLLEGKTVTGFRSIRDDLTNAGARYVDHEVVRDGQLITSRHPGDLPAFCREIISALKESRRLTELPVSVSRAS
jgi:protease I